MYLTFYTMVLVLMRLVYTLVQLRLCHGELVARVQTSYFSLHKTSIIKWPSAYYVQSSLHFGCICEQHRYKFPAFMELTF